MDSCAIQAGERCSVPTQEPLHARESSPSRRTSGTWWPPHEALPISKAPAPHLKCPSYMTTLRAVVGGQRCERDAAHPGLSMEWCRSRDSFISNQEILKQRPQPLCKANARDVNHGGWPSHYLPFIMGLGFTRQTTRPLCGCARPSLPLNNIWPPT